MHEIRRNKHFANYVRYDTTECTVSVNGSNKQRHTKKNNRRAKKEQQQNKSYTLSGQMWSLVCERSTPESNEIVVNYERISQQN